jgi:rubrerythrin
LFCDLAQWEKRHMQVFAEMKERLSEPTWQEGRFDLERVEGSGLDVPSAVFNEYSEPAGELTGRESRDEVLKLAIRKERHTIGYYTSLTEFALGPGNSQAIKDILKEERRHVRILQQSLEQARG